MRVKHISRDRHHSRGGAQGGRGPGGGGKPHGRPFASKFGKQGNKPKSGGGKMCPMCGQVVPDLGRHIREKHDEPEPE
ncbi:MAG: hypothetical protein ACM359_10715 [Bacillota bacterium]